MPTAITIQKWLSGPGKEACTDARAWLKSFPHGTLMSEAWEKCERADWMFWAGLRSHLPENDPRWRQAAFAIVRRTTVAPGKTNWDIMPEAAQRCVEVAERFECGCATLEERSAAESAAETAARSAAETAARLAARSAAETHQASILREFIQNPWETQE